jgi:hypothetical protein
MLVMLATSIQLGGVISESLFAQNDLLVTSISRFPVISRRKRLGGDNRLLLICSSDSCFTHSASFYRFFVCRIVVF